MAEHDCFDLAFRRRRRRRRRLVLVLLCFVNFVIKTNGDDDDAKFFTCHNGIRVYAYQRCDGMQNCADNTDELDCDRFVPPTDQRLGLQSVAGCGRNNNPTPLVYQGSLASPGQYPWQARIYLSTPRSGCGASLISNQWLLSAAHCFFDTSGRQLQKVNVALGKYNLSINHEQNQLIVENAQVFTHPKYISSETTHYNSHNQHQNNWNFDFALIKLPQTIEFTRYIQPICLPSQCDQSYAQTAAIVDGCQEAQFAGWGKTSAYSSPYSTDVLRKTYLTISPRADCNQQLMVQLSTAHICVTGNSPPCQGCPTRVSPSLF